MNFNELFEIKEETNPENSVDFNKKSNHLKHILIRITALFVGIGLIFLIPVFSNSVDSFLGAFYLSLCFVAIWFLFMIIETIVLYINRKNDIANINLIVVLILLFSIGSLILKIA